MAARSLDRIKVSGFKSIRSMDLELRSLNVLIGANGSGKSNFIAIFKLLNQIVENNLQAYVGTTGRADSFLHFGRKTTDRISIRLTFAGDIDGYACVLVPTAEGTLIFQDEECWWNKDGNIWDKQLGSGHKETQLLSGGKRQGIATHVYYDLGRWKIYHFHDTSDNAKVKQIGDISDNRVLRPDGSNLAAFLYLVKIKYPDHYQNIVDGVRLVAPFFDDFILEPASLNPEEIRLEWKERGSDGYFNAFALSDGTLRFICLATLLLQPSLPSIVLLDEPELGLHPYAITILAELLRGASTKTQVIVSTQSVTLVNQFEPQDIIVVEREDNQSVFKHLEGVQMDEWLDDYGLGDLWEKNILGGRP